MHINGLNDRETPRIQRMEAKEMAHGVAYMRGSELRHPFLPQIPLSKACGQCILMQNQEEVSEKK